MTDNIITPAGYAAPDGVRHADAGHKIVPIPAGMKYPKGLARWQDQATDDKPTIVGWLQRTSHGIGWAMGRQPNGTFLVAVDVDGDEGWDELNAWMIDHGDDGFATTVSQRTGRSPGMHYIFESPVEFTNGRLDEHIDIRGEGGFVVIAPTIHPNGNAYEWERNPWNHPTEPLPAWIVAELTPTEPAVVPRETSGEDGDTPADWVRANIPMESLLIEGGWTHGGGDKWTRPGKESREGISAILHDGGPFVIWSTNVSEHYAGRRNSDGSFSMSPLELYAAVHFSGDVSAASSHVRRTLMPRRDTSPPATGKVATGGDGIATSLNLPESFWTERPFLEQIRQAAWSRMESPDALLGAVIARYAAVIPPSYRIPPIVAAPGTFDSLIVLVGDSGGGKSAAMAIARELFPGPRRKDILWDQPSPSGEGLVDGFFEEVLEEKKLVKRKTRTAVHFSVGEAKAVIEAGGRKGATIGSVLCSAWAGENPGQLNASKERRRVDLHPFTYRMTGLMGVQTSLGHELLSEEWVIQGLSGRLVFLKAENEDIPFDGPPWPGELDLPIHPTTNSDLKYAAEIVGEVRREHHERRTGQTTIPPLDTHRNLVRLKLSGILALMDGRKSVSDSDWALATTISTSSRSIRTRLQHLKTERDNRHVEAQGAVAAMREDARDRKAAAILHERARDTILATVAHHGPLNRRAIKDKLSKELRKGDVFTPALDELIEVGKIKRQGPDFV